MQIEAVADPGEEWDAFVEAHPAATLAHAAAWVRVMREAYGLRSHALLARDAAGHVRGVLPLVSFRTLRGALELVSMPFLDTGGVLASDPETERALLDAALAHARTVGARALELRQREPLAGAAETAFVDRVDLALALEASEDAQWSALSAKVRNQTRKATREGLAPAGPDYDLLRGFLDPFRVNMRDLGSPVHGDRFFASAARAFGPRLRFCVACDGTRSVGGLVAIHYGGSVTVPWASTLRAERARCPNNLIYWEALRWAVSLGARELDFGRSPRDAGTYRFKLGWGAKERPLAWARLAPDGRPLPPAAPGDSPVLRRLSELWRRLPPALTDRLGPRLRRRISS
jgi:FemAB-related protein (PEP-CTERM system-associated)